MTDAPKLLSKGEREEIVAALDDLPGLPWGRADGTRWDEYVTRKDGKPVFTCWGYPVSAKKDPTGEKHKASMAETFTTADWIATAPAQVRSLAATIDHLQAQRDRLVEAMGDLDRKNQRVRKARVLRDGSRVINESASPEWVGRQTGLNVAHMQYRSSMLAARALLDEIAKEDG